jgi:hypothetical protein
MKEKLFGYFNHRIIVDEEGVHTVASVYYDTNGIPTDYAGVGGYSDEEGLYFEMIESLEAFTRPTLYVKDIDTSRSTLEAANAYGAGAIHTKLED